MVGMLDASAEDAIEHGGWQGPEHIKFYNILYHIFK